jgi:hypothetical protein
MEQRGVPAVVVGSHLFKALGDVERRALGMPDLSVAITSHPIGGLKSDAVREKADALLEPVVSGLTRA